MANRNFDTRQSLERQIKSLYLKTTFKPTAATVTLPTTTPIVLTKVLLNSLYNGHTFRLSIAAAAANTGAQVLAVWTGTAPAAILTITPNNGTNNGTTAATGTVATTTPIVLTNAVLGIGGNGKTFTVQVAAAAPNPTNTVLAAFSGTAAAITCTITPNDGTNNAATPVPLTTAELVELINSGLVAGKTITVTDAGSLRNDQTATGGGAAALADGGEGDNKTATFAGGVNTAVSLTTAEVVELINTDDVVGKTLAVTDVGNISALATATGGGAALVVDGGEGDLTALPFAGAYDFVNDNYYGISSIVLTAVGTIRISFEDKFNALRYINGLIVDATARDFTFQVKAYDINPTSGLAYVDLYTLTGGTATALAVDSKVMLELTVKNTSVI